MKPIVGITSLLENKPHKAYSSLSQHYIRSVAEAGGVPIIIPNGMKVTEIDAYLDSIDILLLSGGEDVAPYIYGEDPIKEVSYFNPERDSFEMEMTKRAFARKMPVFGICRGMQIINVALGGTIYQDIHKQYKTDLGHMPLELPVNKLYHSIDIYKDSVMHDVFGVESMLVNSYHHQAVKDIGKGLIVTAKAKDGIIEAFEMQDCCHVMGVQFHPEDLTADYPDFVKLFKYFVELGKM